MPTWGGPAEAFFSRYRYAAVKPASSPRTRNVPLSAHGENRGAGFSAAGDFFSRGRFSAGTGGGRWSSFCSVVILNPSPLRAPAVPPPFRYRVPWRAVSYTHLRA